MGCFVVQARAGEWVLLLCRAGRTAEHGDRVGSASLGSRATRRLTGEQGYGMVRDISVILFYYGRMVWRAAVGCDLGWREGEFGVCTCLSTAGEGF